MKKTFTAHIINDKGLSTKKNGKTLTIVITSPNKLSPFTLKVGEDYSIELFGKGWEIISNDDILKPSLTGEQEKNLAQLGWEKTPDFRFNPERWFKHSDGKVIAEEGDSIWFSDLASIRKNDMTDIISEKETDESEKENKNIPEKEVSLPIEKKKRGRPRKNPIPDPNIPKRKRGRPRKNPVFDPIPTVPKKRGRPRKNPIITTIETLPAPPQQTEDLL